MVAEVKFDQRKGRRGPASRPFCARPVRSSDLWLDRSFSEGLAPRKHASGNPFAHDMAGGRPVGEKPTLRVEQSAFAYGHLPTDM